MSDTAKPAIGSKAGVACVSFGTALLALLVVQNTSATLLARYTRTKYNYDVNNMLLVSEMMKLLASMVIENFTYKKADSQSNEGETDEEKAALVAPVPDEKDVAFPLLQSFRYHIFENPVDALKLSIPSILYLVQNSLVYYSIALIPVPLFQITQQTKLVTTALLSVCILKRSYNSIQWSSVVSLCIGTAVCILSSAGSASADSDTEKFKKSNLFGLLLVVLSNLSSSIAGVYFEIVIKGTSTKAEKENKKAPASIWMRNIQLASFSISILLIKLITKQDKAPFFYDFTPLLWIQISIFAFGGLLVASVIKYTDSVQKGLASGLSVVTSSALSTVIEADKDGLSLNFIIGSSMAIGGCFCFANPGTVKQGFGAMQNPEGSAAKIAVYGLVFVVGSFVSLGSAYMALQFLSSLFTK